MKSTFSNYLLIVLFFGCIIFPTVDKRLSLTPISMYYTENRPLIKKPEFDVKQIAHYPEKFESYYNDNFRLRGQIIKFYNKLCMSLFKKSPIPDKVIIGKQGWLFLAGEDLSIYMGTNLFTPSELKKICRELEYRRDYLAKRNCKFYIAIIPSKTRIYNDYMPNNIDVLNPVGFSEQFIQYLRENSSLTVINLFSELKERRKQGKIYFKTDNHWNDIGGYYGSQVIIKAMQKDFPTLPDLPYNSIRIDSVQKIGGYAAIMLSIADEVNETIYTVHPITGAKSHEGKKHPYTSPENFKSNLEYEVVMERADTTLPKIVVIRDSFGNSLIPSFSESFSKSVYILDNWEYKLNEDIINTEKPDIVLLSIYEPLLKNLRWHHSLKEKKRKK